jgi:nephrocystin-3
LKGEIEDVMDSRTLRVFISSTFLDMHAERELLVKRVFPEMRRLCAERSVTFTEVDLRWGITEEQSAEGRVLPICLEEIERSRPFFIGLLGERYGWIANDFSPEIVAREPWLKEHVSARTSVTELEILHGVLRKPVMHGRSYFYFRDPGYLDRLPPGSDRGSFDSEGNEGRHKLRHLKSLIRDAHRNGVCRLLENYRDPEALAEAVRADLIELIDWRYPKESVPDPLDQEAQGHAAYAQSKRFAYVERPAHTAEIDAAIAGDGPPLVITGERGGGKTSLLASWARHWAERHPDGVLFEHYFGVTADSASATAFLQRLLGELKRRYDIRDDIPIHADKLREALPRWFAQTVDRGPIVLLIDGLDQIAGDEPDRRVAFLPTHFPAHVRIVASALPGPALEAWRDRRWAECSLLLPDRAEREEMIDAFLGAYGKTLSPGLRRALIEAPGAANPLFLRTMLEELRQFGSFEALPARVAHYLEADTSEELFRRVIRRWQADFDANDDLVRRALCVAWAARHGVAEAEWLELLGEPDNPLPRQRCRPLLLALEPHLVQRSGLYGFGHEFLRKAVELEFLALPDAQRAAHRMLADYFERQPGMTPRKAAEWPWQLQRAMELERLHRSLRDLRLFDAIVDSAPYELLGYWRSIETTPYTLDAACAVLVYQVSQSGADASKRSRLVRRLGRFCRLAGRLETSARILECAVRIAQESAMRDGPESADTHLDWASVLAELGQSSEAERIHRSAVTIYEKSAGPEHLLTAAGLQALALHLSHQGAYEEAEQTQRRALAITEKALGPQHRDTAIALVHLAGLLQTQGRYVDGENVQRRALAICELTLGTEHPLTATALEVLANLRQWQGALSDAEHLLRRVLSIYRRTRGPEDEDTVRAMMTLALLPGLQRPGGEAETLVREALSINESKFGDRHPRTAGTLHLLGSLLHVLGRNTEAEPVERRAVEILASLGSEHQNTIDVLTMLARILGAQGRYAEAEPVHRRAVAVSEKIFGAMHPTTMIAIRNLAYMLERANLFDEADSLYRRALDGLTTAFGHDHPHAIECRSNLARLMDSRHGSQADQLERSGRFAEALPVRQAVVQHVIQSRGAEHPDVALALNRLALLLRTMNRAADAETHLRHAIEIERRVLPPDSPTHPHRLNNLCTVLVMQGKLDEAKRCSADAWGLAASRHDITTARIAFVGLTVAMIEHEPIQSYVGLLKTLLTAGPLGTAGGVAATWNIDSYLASLRPRLSSSGADFIEALSAALNDRAAIVYLDRYPAWSEPVSVPLDVAWPR